MSLLYAKGILQNDKTDKNALWLPLNILSLWQEKAVEKDICLVSAWGLLLADWSPNESAASCWHVSEMRVPLPHTWGKESRTLKVHLPPKWFHKSSMWPWHFLSFCTKARVDTHISVLISWSASNTWILLLTLEQSSGKAVAQTTVHISSFSLTEDLSVSCNTYFQQMYLSEHYLYLANRSRKIYRLQISYYHVKSHPPTHS